jgi:hypothetical protein
VTENSKMKFAYDNLNLSIKYAKKSPVAATTHLYYSVFETLRTHPESHGIMKALTSYSDSPQTNKVSTSANTHEAFFRFVEYITYCST